MSFSIASTQMVILVSSIFLLFSAQSVVASPALIQKVCSNTNKNFDSKLCLQILQSEKQAASARNFFDLSIIIMELGISNATNMRAYLENLHRNSNTGPNVKAALQECKLSYDSVIVSLNSALNEVKESKEYLTATYDLLVASTDNFQRCQDAVAREKITDETILSGNKAVPIFGLSAYEAVSVLGLSTTTLHM